MVGHKIRLRFRKALELRLLSHLDLLRCFERTCRRAGLPLKFSAGFHPAPRIVLALSLPLGIVGTDEVVELELTEPLAAEEVRKRLQESAPHGLDFLSAAIIDERRQAFPRRVVYRLSLPPDRIESTRAASDRLLASERVWVERTRPRPRRLNIRPYLRGIRISGDTVELDLWVTQTGTARADELVRLLGIQDLLDDGAVLTRTDLELHDELQGSPGDAPPDGPPETEPLQVVPAGADEDASPTATWGVTPNGPVVE